MTARQVETAPLMVNGVCVHCSAWATGPLYDSPVPSDRYDLISGHKDCPGRRPSDAWRPSLAPQAAR